MVVSRVMGILSHRKFFGFYVGRYLQYQCPMFCDSLFSIFLIIFKGMFVDDPSELVSCEVTSNESSYVCDRGEKYLSVS